METYYKKQRVEPVDAPAPTPSDASQRVLSSEYKRYCQTLLETEDGEGWSSELRRYLKDRPADVTKGTDIVKWWQAS
jgi:IMP cyclohydrolase